MSQKRRRPTTMRTIRKSLRAFGKGYQNALELMRDGRLGAPYSAPFEVVFQEGFLRLRRYDAVVGAEPVGQPLLLIPPLMVTTQVYDISPELSAVSWLLAQGIDIWITDFGAPEKEEGGMQRTLDDHVLAIDKAIDVINQETGQDVHLGGYSQGGMFAYLTAGYRKNRGMASVIAFGSPVDMRKNVPGKPGDDIASKMLTAAGLGLRGVIGDLEGLSGAMSSHGFKLASPKQEIKYLFKMLGMLPNKEKLERSLPQRRFLGGEGFIAFPGPALRTFLKEFIASNRLMTGGLVINGQPCHLGEITIPIVYFVGSRDTFARPEAVRAIDSVVASKECHEVEIVTGHFGLVVGSKAMQITWPTVYQWINWLDEAGPRPEHIALPPGEARVEPEAGDELEDLEINVSLVGPEAGSITNMYDLATGVLDGMWGRLGEMPKVMANVVEAMRWQLPRLARLASLEHNTRISAALALAQQAEAIPDAPFFIWEGRAFTYRRADQRVNRVLHALLQFGARPAQHIGVLMHNHPDLLTTVTAVNRMGGVAVLLPSESRGSSLAHALKTGEVDMLVCGPDHVEEAHQHFGDDPVLVLGATGMERPLPEGIIDLDAVLDPDLVGPPEAFKPNPGRADDLAMLMFTSGTTGLPKAAYITNRRWGMAALGSAAACALTPTDTVYCALPLHHATGLLVAVGGAMVGGSRLVLTRKFSASTFLSDVRKTGSNVVFYVGELCRYLVGTDVKPDDKHHPIRLFAGNGMRPDVWRRLLERFGDVQVIEFYGSTEGNAVLANLTGEKVGSIGRPLLQGQGVELVQYDLQTNSFVRGEDGRMKRCESEQPGVLLARLLNKHPMGRFDGYTDDAATEEKILRDVFEEGDAWFNSGDMLRRDEDGDYWFVDRLGDTFRWKGENVSTEQVQSVLIGSPQIALTVVYGVQLPGREGRAGMAAVELKQGSVLDGPALFELATEHLPSYARPQFVRVVPELATTASLKFMKTRLIDQGADPSLVSDPVYVCDAKNRTYTRLTQELYARVVEKL